MLLAFRGPTRAVLGASIVAVTMISLFIQAPAFAAPNEVVFRSADGTVLAGRIRRAARLPRGLVLLAHGLHGNSEWFAQSGLMDALSAGERAWDGRAGDGFTVLAFDRRGSGRSVEEARKAGQEQLPGHAASADAILEDYRAAIERLRLEDPAGTLPLHLVGEGFGALPVLILAAEMGERVATVTLLSPTLQHQREANFRLADRAAILADATRGSGTKYFESPVTPEMLLCDRALLPAGALQQQEQTLEWLLSRHAGLQRAFTSSFFLSAETLRGQAQEILRAGWMTRPTYLLRADHDLVANNGTLGSMFSGWLGGSQVWGGSFSSGHLLGFGREGNVLNSYILRWLLSKSP